MMTINFPLLVEEFMRIESVKNIVGDKNSKDTGNDDKCTRNLYF